MFSKFHWGHGITIFYIVFVSVVIFALYASMQVDHGLVVEDYYQKDLEYQTQLDKMNSSIQKDDISVLYKNEDQKVIINIGSTDRIKGTVHFYRPSDKTKDITRPLDSAHFEYNTKEMIRGKWIIKVDWTENNRAYYHEHVVFI